MTQNAAFHSLENLNLEKVQLRALASGWAKFYCIQKGGKQARVGWNADIFAASSFTWVWGSLAKGGGQRPWLLVLLVFLKKSPLRISNVLFTGQTFLKTVNWWVTPTASSWGNDCSLETRNWWVATARRRKLSVAVLQQARLGSGMLSPVIFHFRLWAGLVQGLQCSSVGRAAVILKSVYPKCIGWQDLRFKIYRRGGVVPSHSVLAKLYLAEILSSVLLCRHVCKCVFVFSPFPYTVEVYSTVCVRSHLVYFT